MYPLHPAVLTIPFPLKWGRTKGGLLAHLGANPSHRTHSVGRWVTRSPKTLWKFILISLWMDFGNPLILTFLWHFISSMIHFLVIQFFSVSQARNATWPLLTGLLCKGNRSAHISDLPFWMLCPQTHLVLSCSQLLHTLFSLPRRFPVCPDSRCLTNSCLSFWIQLGLHFCQEALLGLQIRAGCPSVPGAPTPACAYQVHRTYQVHTALQLPIYLSASPLDCHSETGLQPPCSPLCPRSLANDRLITGAAYVCKGWTHEPFDSK